LWRIIARVVEFEHTRARFERCETLAFWLGTACHQSIASKVSQSSNPIVLSSELEQLPPATRSKMLSLQALVLSALWATGINAGDITHWMTTTCWETAEQEAVTYWSTSTCWETQWSTAPPETVWNTVWSTYVQPTTYISVETTTSTVTKFIYSTENIYYTNTATEIQVSRETATATETGTVTGTVTATITSASVIVSTFYATVTEACTTSLAGLVLCPYRDVNPTYTPPGPLPTDYLWAVHQGLCVLPNRSTATSSVTCLLVHMFATQRTVLFRHHSRISAANGSTIIAHHTSLWRGTRT